MANSFDQSGKLRIELRNNEIQEKIWCLKLHIASIYHIMKSNIIMWYLNVQLCTNLDDLEVLILTVYKVALSQHHPSTCTTNWLFLLALCWWNHVIVLLLINALRLLNLLSMHCISYTISCYWLFIVLMIHGVIYIHILRIWQSRHCIIASVWIFLMSTCAILCSGSCLPFFE